MKYIKTYENLKNEDPKIGDYIQIKIIDEDYNDTDVILNNFINFLNNNIGQIIRVYNNDEVRIKYDDVPSLITSWFEREIHNFNIEYSKRTDLTQVDYYIVGKNPEDVKMKIDSNKYNL